MTPKTDYLLDSSVLIALCSPDHASHAVASRWFAAVGGSFGTCAITQGAFIRIYVMTSGQSAQGAQGILRKVAALKRHRFLSEDLSYVDVDCSRVVGHRQVTDAYLVGLAQRYGMVLATFDIALAALYPEGVVLVA